MIRASCSAARELALTSSRPRRHGRRRAAFAPRFEALEGRLTPTTLPGGFAQATIVSGLSNPTAMEFSPDGRLFVLEQGGDVELVRGDGTTWTALHLNVDSRGERGLLGIAFDPNYASNHFVYLYYTNPNAGAAPWATGEHNQLSRFTVDDSDPTRPRFSNEAAILDWDNLSAATNHNGGAIHFGIDGKLYAEAGDNAQTFTQGANTFRVSQTLSNLLGKQLRIDVSAFNSGVATRDDTAVGHLIPADNPFVGTAPGINKLIYALGLRNPFASAVQPGTGTIFINDAGERNWEEINRSVAGANFGWSGDSTDGFDHPSPPGPGVYHDPVLAYSHSGGPAGGGVVIVGGAFYNPATPQFPASFIGKYFYADLSGWIRVFDPSKPGSAFKPDTSAAFADDISGGPVDLKVDSAGSLYYLTNAGAVVRISYQSPRITAQPAGQAVDAGQTATFTVAATGPSLHYQWQHMVGSTWTNVGTNSPALAIQNATASDAGAYRVIVANTFGSATSATATLTVNVPSPPPLVLVPGLKAEFFDFTTRLRTLPDLGGRAADVTRTDSVLAYAATRSPWAGLDSRFADTFASRHTGLLKVDTPGRYTLSLASNDGSRLWLDGVLLINNNGAHRMRRRSRTLTLSAGLHSLEVDYFENTGPAGLILLWSGPGIARQVVPAGNLFQRTTTAQSSNARGSASSMATGTPIHPRFLGGLAPRGPAAGAMTFARRGAGRLLRMPS